MGKDRSSFVGSSIYDYIDDRKTTVKDIKKGKPQLLETYVILDEIRNYVNQ